MNVCKSFFSNFVTDYNSIFSAWWHIVSPYSATLCFRIARSLLSLQVVASRQTIIDPSLHQEFAGKLKSSPFFIAIDESNGKGLWQVLNHLCAIFHRSVTNQLPCHASLQHRKALYQTSSIICFVQVFIDNNTPWSNLVSVTITVRPCWKEYYTGFLEFTGTEPIKIQKHGSTKLGEKCWSFNAPLASLPELFQLEWGCRDAWTGEAPVPLIAATRVYTCTELFILIPSASFPRIRNKLTPCFKQMSSVLVIYFDDEITSFLRKFKRKFVKTKGIHSSEDPTAFSL